MVQSLKINIITIPEEGLSLRFSLPGNLLSGLCAGAGEPDFTLEKVDVAGTVRKSHQNIFFTGTLETIVETTCCRCIEAAQVPIKTDFRYTLLPETGTGKEEAELQTEDLDVAYYSGEIIDLAPMIAEQIILQVPMKVLCRETCRGLCPHCGVNLNLASCDCPAALDPRLAVLKDFKVK